jgi:AraC-like DNA-binding protein
MNIPSPMAKPQTFGTLPTVQVFEISDPTAADQAIEVIKQDVVQLESKPLRVRRVVVRLGKALVLFHSTNLAVRTRTKLHPDFVAYTTFAPKALGTVNGLPVGHDRVLTCKPGIEVELVVAAGYESVAFLVPPQDLRAHLRSRHREDEFNLPQSIELLSPSLAAAHELYRWGRRLIDLATRQPELFDLQQTQHAAQVELIENLLTTVSSAVHSDLVPHDVTRQTHSRVVQSAEEYTLSHNSEPLYVSDICEATGVSERTLQYAFKEVMGMTPMAYLTRLRLHQVRKSLRAATHGTTTVTAEALRWGFWHFGDFSRSYKECFGELPSETLRQSNCAS